MGVREKLIEFEENQGKRCEITLVTVSGKSTELTVNNCRCVKNCDDNYIVLSVYGMDIRVTGAPLELENFGVGSVKITGKIHSLSFEET